MIPSATCQAAKSNGASGDSIGIVSFPYDLFFIRKYSKGFWWQFSVTVFLVCFHGMI